MHTSTNESEPTFPHNDQSSDTSSTANSLWYHSLQEPVPDQFKFGPLYGKQIYLASIICPSFSQTVDPRALHSLARQGFLWIRRPRGAQLCEVFFLNEHIYEQVKQRDLAQEKHRKNARANKK
jgi:hypothetical protein